MAIHSAAVSMSCLLRVVEFHNYLRFQIEPDRNEGNINILVQGSVIHHLDFKAPRPTPWGDAAKREIAPFLVESLVCAIKQGQNLADLLSDLGGNRDELSQEGFDLLTELETALMSLAPYIAHLNKQDLQEIALAVLDAGMDPILAETAAKNIPDLPAPLSGIAEAYLRGDRGLFIPSLTTILKIIGLPQYASMIGKIKL
jgi:hypothetical protein